MVKLVLQPAVRRNPPGLILGSENVKTFLDLVNSLIILLVHTI